MSRYYTFLHADKILEGQPTGSQIEIDCSKYTLIGRYGDLFTISQFNEEKRSWRQPEYIVDVTIGKSEYTILCPNFIDLFAAIPTLVALQEINWE